jgi:hypothetical protein
LGRLHEG